MFACIFQICGVFMSSCKKTVQPEHTDQSKAAHGCVILTSKFHHRNEKNIIILMTAASYNFFFKFFFLMQSHQMMLYMFILTGKQS